MGDEPTTGILPGMEAHAGRDLALGQWDTHPELARAFVRWCGVKGAAVIEPSCGIGNVAVAALGVGGARVVLGVELDPARASLARDRRIDGFQVVDGDIFDPVVRQAVPMADVAIGNPPYEGNGALRHASRWMEFAPRACFIAPLETLAGEREGLWEAERMHLRRVAVCAPYRPPFGLAGHGMSEIAFFEVVDPAYVAVGGRIRPTIERLNWRALGKP